MQLDATARRRWFGGICLGVALAMLLCGQTFLEGRLTKTTYVVYWLICFVLTGLAMIVALRDLRSVSQRTRQEQRQLLEEALKKVESEAKKKSQDKNIARRRLPNGE